MSLFQYLADVAKYSQGRTAQELVASYVTDADSKTWIAAETAVYVDGSSARGPMRAGNLPAFASADAARRFAERRGGKLLSFRQVDAAVLERIAPGRTQEPHLHEAHSTN
ncbi:MAG: hypothetical protein B7X79_12685 [Acidovorax sp. 17-64-282]|nr:MAG: hypothetical protein B7X79_12685 [Acidovorax sp. 17-64-282]